MNELISIIVPVYNVEQYISKCIDSIINQTYKNIEIILVDDGSSDRSGCICDEYKEKDNRIIVIHKENGGMSDARNVGLKVASGKYIGFVDSDDYIEYDMFEKLYNNIIQYNANISMCSFIHEFPSGEKKEGKIFDKQITILTPMEALKNLIVEKNLSNHLWNKLYERKLFEDIIFPFGKKMEDVSTLYKLFEKANTLVYDNSIEYHYIQRGNSIMGKIDLKLINDTEESVFEKNSYLKNKYPDLEDYINIENIKTYKLLHYYAKIGNYNSLIESDKYEEFYKIYKELYPKYRKDIKKLLDRKVALSYDLFYFSKKLYFLYLKLK